MAKVAMAHGINDNVVHGWRKLARDSGPAAVAKQAEFVPVAVAPAFPHSADARGNRS